MPASSAGRLVRVHVSSLGTEATRTSTALAILVLPTARRGDKPHFKGILGPQLREYRFSLGDGIYKDSTGDVVWDELTVDIDKAERRGQRRIFGRALERFATSTSVGPGS